MQVTPGHYLYRDKLSVSTGSTMVQLGRLELPEGELKVDEWFGEMQVYHGDVFAKLPLARATPEAMDLDIVVGYQGCADEGLCYPPQTRILTVSLPPAATISAFSAASAAPVSEQARLAQLISGQASTWSSLHFLEPGCCWHSLPACCQWSQSSQASLRAKAIT